MLRVWVWPTVSQVTLARDSHAHRNSDERARRVVPVGSLLGAWSGPMRPLPSTVAAPLQEDTPTSEPGTLLATWIVLEPGLRPAQVKDSAGAGLFPLGVSLWPGRLAFRL